MIIDIFKWDIHQRQKKLFCNFDDISIVMNNMIDQYLILLFIYLNHISILYK